MEAASVESASASRASSRGRREAIEGYLWISPWIIGFIVFTAGPFIASSFLSLTEYQIGGSPQWIGFDNYRRAFYRDDLFLSSMGRTLYFAFFNVLFGVTGSLILAVLLDKARRGLYIWRAIYYLPSLTPAVATAILWQWLLHPQVGLMNDLLRRVGIPGPGWMSSTTWAMPSMILIALWGSMGGQRMIIYLAGLQGVPTELYEASEIDGANAIQQFFHVTLPLITPTILFNLILSVIGSFNVFTIAYVATGGGPARATWFYMLHLYHNAFSYYQMGYASALAWILFAVVMFLTALQLISSRHWVYYEFSGGAA